MDKLALAVECCTSKSCEWEETCGRCPFNDDIEENRISSINCVDALLLALLNKVKALEQDKNDVEDI